MTTAEKNSLLKWNTILWIAAMALPALFSLAFSSSKFPWQVIVPFLLFGCLLASNKMLARAICETTSDAPSKAGNE